jgi:hypothetical protein
VTDVACESEASFENSSGSVTDVLEERPALFKSLGEMNASSTKFAATASVMLL